MYCTFLNFFLAHCDVLFMSSVSKNPVHTNDRQWFLPLLYALYDIYFREKLSCFCICTQSSLLLKAFGKKNLKHHLMRISTSYFNGHHHLNFFFNFFFFIDVGRYLNIESSYSVYALCIVDLINYWMSAKDNRSKWV